MIDQTLYKLIARGDLSGTPPAEPMELLAAWYEEARRSKKYDDFNAMSLATSTPDGLPSVRIVLCKSIDIAEGAVTFYTNYLSRKGREIDSNPRAAGAFHWPHAKRQVRIEGFVERVSAAESEAYFNSRPLLSRIGACVSPQSAPIGSMRDIVEAALALSTSAALGRPIQRPPHWGGYRIRLRSVELWSGRTGRLHQRVVWKRAAPGGGSETAWTWERLAP
ncbi:MAG: pyridoxamine 5'-phosphate oxidase [Phycisphaerales bacterium]